MNFMSKNKNIIAEYVSEYENQDIDIDKLKNKSYDFLIKNRNQDLNKLLKSKTKIKNF